VTAAGERFLRVVALIDEANRADPSAADTPEGRRPAELVYGERMSAMLSRFRPAASEHLAIAARGQHIERWLSPRASYPAGRVGYLRWRSDLKSRHARRVGELMAAAGYPPEGVARVEALVRKERLKYDPEAQALEDVACLVFLAHYAEEFIARHDDAKVIDILRKTAVKMSPEGLAAATELPLPERLARLLRTALEA
jgi:hypothetical protein